jgi:hypothetical protein
MNLLFSPLCFHHCVCTPCKFTYREFHCVCTPCTLCFITASLTLKGSVPWVTTICDLALTGFILFSHCMQHQKFAAELAFSGFEAAALPIELSSQRGLVATLIELKCTKYFHNDLTLVLKDAQCFNTISEPSSEIWKTSFIFFCRNCRVNEKFISNGIRTRIWDELRNRLYLQWGTPSSHC